MTNVNTYIVDEKARAAGESAGRIGAKRAIKDGDLLPIRRMLDERIEANQAGIDLTKQAEVDYAIGALIGAGDELRRAAARLLRSGLIDCWLEKMIELMFEAFRLKNVTTMLCFEAARAAESADRMA